MTPPPQYEPASRPTRRVWRRTLLLLGVVGAVVLGIAFRGIGTAPSWFMQEGMSPMSMIWPVGAHPTAGEQEETDREAATKGKRDKQAKPKENNHGTDKRNKQGKGKREKQAKNRSKARAKDHPSKRNAGPTADRDERSTVTDALDRSGPYSLNSDGQLTVASAEPLIFPAVADGRVEEANPTTNYGSADLRVDGGADPDIQSYLRFELSDVTDTVRNATLRLWVPAGGGTGNGPAVFRAPNTWTEGGLTWANRPGPTGTVLNNKAAIPEGAGLITTLRLR